MKKKISIESVGYLTLLLFLLLLPSSLAARTAAQADLVVVQKSQRQLQLIAEGRILRTFPIALGKNPVGHKQYEGDGRTPEGRYVLDWRNPRSRFYKSIHISYPNRRDYERALRRGQKPGHAIMIHGIPNEFAQAPELFEAIDWTEGCIAVSNDAIEEIWRMVANNTPIEIYP